ncbi:MAG: TlpA family protein disulfide reductase [Acidobacteria bacterium]|nr:TlpA family protein disulfide reductase [Acidobacteriota bacterium]
MPGWQTLYAELKDKNFEIISVAQDTGGAKDAAPWITKANPQYTALIDETQIITRLYDMVNVPTAVWINEKGKIVRPNETAYVDNRYKVMHGLDATEYLNAIRDWASNGDKSAFVLSEDELKARLAPQQEDHAQASAEFALAEFLSHQGLAQDAIPHYKEAQRLNPDNWNYKRQAWALTNAEKDYGTNWGKEVQKLGTKPYYPPRKLKAEKH